MLCRTVFSLDSGLIKEKAILICLLRWMAAATLLASPTLVEAQTLGLVGGINRSSIKGDAPDKTSYGRTTRPTIGGLAEFRLSKEVWLHTELLFSQRGTRVGKEVAGQREPQYDAKLLFNYVSVPVLVRIGSASGRMYATSGIDLAFLTKATLEQDGLPDTDVKDQLLSTDLAANFGVGGFLHQGRPSVNLELRYSQSILNLADNIITEQSIPVRFRSNGFQLLASVFWPLGGVQ